LTDRQITRTAQGLDEDVNSPDHSSLQAAEMKMREALGLGGGGRRDSAPARQPQDQPRPTQHRPMGDRPNGAGHRHRFVQDGEVPVVLVSNAGGASSPSGAPRGGGDIRAPNPRTATLAADVSAERSGRERAERQFQHAQAIIRDLETKLAHADIARMEAVNGAKVDRTMMLTVREELRAQVAQLRDELTAARAAREFAESRLRDALAAQPRWERPTRSERPAAEPAPAKPGRKPRVAAADKPPRISKRAVAEPKPVKWWVKGKGLA
jgi:hypothetical protein